MKKKERNLKSFSRMKQSTPLQIVRAHLSSLKTDKRKRWEKNKKKERKEEKKNLYLILSVTTTKWRTDRPVGGLARLTYFS